MDQTTYIAHLQGDTIGFTFADSEEQALEQLEFALAQQEILDTSTLEVTRLPSDATTVLIDNDR